MLERGITRYKLFVEAMLRLCCVWHFFSQVDEIPLRALVSFLSDGAVEYLTVGLRDDSHYALALRSSGFHIGTCRIQSHARRLHLHGVRMILFGSSLTSLGCLLILLFSILGNGDPRWLWLLFAPVNLGLGLRGPPGFYQAVVAAGDNDSRGAALLILFILGFAAIGTAIVAPFISQGLFALSIAASSIACSSVFVLLILKAPHHKPDQTI